MASPVHAPVIAPLWKRGVASLIDSLPLFVLALGLQGPVLRTRRQRRRFELAVMALSGAYHISFTAKRGQTVGQMLLGVQVVDVTTAGVPTLKRSAVRWAVAVVPEGLVQLVPLSARVETTLAAITELEPEIDRLRKRHEGDPQRLNEELLALFKEADVNPVEAWLPVVLRALPSLALSCAFGAPALQGPRHQALGDRLAGTVVVEARSRRRGA